MNYLLDTCTLSELSKPHPDAGLAKWLDEADETTLHISVITLGEIRQGISMLAESKRKHQLERWLQGDLSARFVERVLPFGAAEAQEWGRLSGEARRSGAPVPVVDAMIAATAKVHGLVLVTRNVSDFARLPVELENPWTD